jgi:sRNA-binding regulator protein Hfq
MTDEAVKKEKATERRAPLPPSTFIPRLLGKKVTLRLVGGGQPITGVMEEFTPYELRVRVNMKEYVVFKHAVATIEVI